MDHYVIPHSPGNRASRRLMEELSGYNLLLVSVHSENPWNRTDYGIPDGTVEFMRELSASKLMILDIFGSPYILGRIRGVDDLAAIVMSYQDKEISHRVSAQMIFGGMAFRGRLPVNAGLGFSVGDGIPTQQSRLAFVPPERLGIEDSSLLKVDSLVNYCLEEKVFPGCQVLAAKDGMIFFNKTYGYHTYDKKIPVKSSDIYDLASITKVAATALGVMKLSETGRMDIDMPLSMYLPFLRGTDKSRIIIREIMAHQSGFRAWIPYYLATIDNGKPDPQVFKSEIDEDFSIRVAEGLYINYDYKYSIFDSIRNSKLRDDFSYKYSDLGFYLIKEAIEQTVNEPYDQWLEKNFYMPLGLKTTGFQPRKRYSLDRIPPTERDKTFRKQLIHGDVHDQGAAMLGGISGHAGLFGNANDMAVILQMLLNKGFYGGKTYLDGRTIKEFTKMQFPLNGNRRGIGFDKPLIIYEDDGPNCESASPSSFGHSGFTGTYMWADPENGLLYVFLSNRVYPDAWNNKISEFNVRTSIHQLFYDAVENADPLIQLN
jgi:CubicO group peptidase (beta-lactamase class C family)